MTDPTDVGLLLTHERFAGYSDGPLADPRAAATGAHYALSVDTREEVDAMVERALANGGASAGEPQDHGFMYSSTFYDPDGHHWNVFWMDPAAIAG